MFRQHRRQLALAFIAFSLLTGRAASSAAAEATAPARATLAQVYAAEALYTCPMHAAVVSADPKLDCPLCGMHLSPLGAEARAALVAQKLVGCPMDPIVVPARNAPPCPICGMALSAIAAPNAGTSAAAPVAPAGCCKH